MVRASMNGHMSAHPIPSADDPAAIVEAYLRLHMIPDPDAARAYCAPGLEIRFTGNRLMHDPAEATAFNRSRYKWVKKRFGPTHVVAGGSQLFQGIEPTPGFGLKLHAVQQDNVQHLLIGEMLLEASASHLADAVVGGDVVDRPQQGSIRIAPFTVARANVLDFVERQSTVNSPDDVRGPFVPAVVVPGDSQYDGNAGAHCRHP